LWRDHVGACRKETKETKREREREREREMKYKKKHKHEELGYGRVQPNASCILNMWTLMQHFNNFL